MIYLNVNLSDHILTFLSLLKFTLQSQTDPFAHNPPIMNKALKFRTIRLHNKPMKHPQPKFISNSALTIPIHFNHLLTNPHFPFSTSTSDPLANFTFEQLIRLKSTESLTRAAQIIAELEIQHENLDSEIAKLQQEFLQYPEQNQALMERIQNIVDNVKLQQQENTEIEKRAEKELQDAKKYAISKVAKQVLEVSDNLERSIKHSQKICRQTHSEVKQFHKQLQEQFKKFGIEEFDPVGKQYDPNSQQSMVKLSLPETMSAEEKAKKSNTVVECFRTGYMIKGRLLRSAHVVVYE